MLPSPTLILYFCYLIKSSYQPELNKFWKILSGTVVARLDKWDYVVKSYSHLSWAGAHCCGPLDSALVARVHRLFFIGFPFLFPLWEKGPILQDFSPAALIIKSFHKFKSFFHQL